MNGLNHRFDPVGPVGFTGSGPVLVTLVEICFYALGPDTFVFSVKSLVSI
jgi:hypothetical protein